MPRASFRLPQAATRGGGAPPRVARMGRASFCREATPRVGQAGRSGAGVPGYPACPARRWACVLLRLFPSALHPTLFTEVPGRGVLRSSYPALCIALVLQVPERSHSRISRQGKAGRAPASVTRGPYFLPRNQRTIVTLTSFSLDGVCAGAGYAQRVDLPIVVLHWVRSFL